MIRSARAALAALCLAATAAAILLPTLSCALEPASAAAPDPAALAPEVAQLREQIAQLRLTLERLDQRLRQIQGSAAADAPPAAALPPVALPVAAATTMALPTPAAPPPAAPAAAGSATPAPPGLDAHAQAVLQEQVRTTDALSAWQGLHNGMHADEVRRLLGEPQSTLAVGNRTGWIYIYRGAGKGSVFFGADGTVVSLMSPGQGALHLY